MAFSLPDDARYVDAQIPKGPLTNAPAHFLGFNDGNRFLVLRDCENSTQEGEVSLREVLYEAN